MIAFRQVSWLAGRSMRAGLPGVDPQWPTVDAPLSAHSCGGSSGFEALKKASHRIPSGPSREPKRMTDA